jgi:uncharacterized protein DUF1707
MSTESADTPITSRLRASDAEREEYARIVREAVGEGRLDIAEGDERLAAIYAARFQDELRPLVRDLPEGQAIAGERRRPVASGSAAEAWSRRAGHRDWSGYRPGYPASGFLAHAGFVTVVTAVLVGLWLLSAAHFFWPAIPIFFLVMGLGRHWRWASWRRYHERGDARR